MASGARLAAVSSGWKPNALPRQAVKTPLVSVRSCPLPEEIALKAGMHLPRGGHCCQIIQSQYLGIVPIVNRFNDPFQISISFKSLIIKQCFQHFLHCFSPLSLLSPIDTKQPEGWQLLRYLFRAKTFPKHSQVHENAAKTSLPPTAWPGPDAGFILSCFFAKIGI